MQRLLRRLWADEQGQDIAEYAVMLAVILLLVVGTIKLIGTNANSTFSNVAGISAPTSFNLGSRPAAAINSRINWSSISAAFPSSTGKRTVASIPDEVYFNRTWGWSSAAETEVKLVST